MRNAHRILIGNPEEKISLEMHTEFNRKLEEKTLLGRHMSKFEGNINMTLKGILYEGVNWIQVTQDTDQ
jgi:hypothetical protein